MKWERPPRIQIDPGGEWLLPFAQSKLQALQRHLERFPAGPKQRTYEFPAGSVTVSTEPPRITIRSSAAVAFTITMASSVPVAWRADALRNGGMRVHPLMPTTQTSPVDYAISGSRRRFVLVRSDSSGEVFVDGTHRGGWTAVTGVGTTPIMNAVGDRIILAGGADGDAMVRYELDNDGQVANLVTTQLRPLIPTSSPDLCRLIGVSRDFRTGYWHDTNGDTILRVIAVDLEALSAGVVVASVPYAAPAGTTFAAIPSSGSPLFCFRPQSGGGETFTIVRDGVVLATLTLDPNEDVQPSAPYSSVSDDGTVWAMACASIGAATVLIVLRHANGTAALTQYTLTTPATDQMRATLARSGRTAFAVDSSGDPVLGFFLASVGYAVNLETGEVGAVEPPGSFAFKGWHEGSAPGLWSYYAGRGPVDHPTWLAFGSDNRAALGSLKALDGGGFAVSLVWSVPCGAIPATDVHQGVPLGYVPFTG